MFKLNRIIRIIKYNHFFRSVMILISSSSITQLLSLISLPFLSRLFNPVNFGDYAIFISISSIINFSTSFGLSSAILSPNSDSDAIEIIKSSIFLLFFSVFIIILISIIFFDFIPIVLFGFNSMIAIILLLFNVAINQIKNLMLNYSNRIKDNQGLFRSTILFSIILIFFNFFFGLIGLVQTGLVYSLIISGFISTIYLVLKLKIKIFNFNFQEIKNTLITYKHFIFFQYPSNFLENLSIQLPIQIIGSLYGSSSLAPYNMSERLLGSPLRLIAQPISTIYFRTAMEYRIKNRDLSDFTFKLVIFSMSIGLIPLVIFFVWGEAIITFILGNSWIDIVKYIPVLFLYNIYNFTFTCTSYLRVSYNKIKTNALFSFLRMLLIVISLTIGNVFFDDVIYTYYLFVMASIIYFSIDMIVNLNILGKMSMRYLIFSFFYMLLIGLLFLSLNLL